MTKVLASTYRYTERNDKGEATRHVFGPGTPVSDLPKGVAEDLEKRKLVVEDDRLTSTGLRIPPGMDTKEENVTTLREANRSRQSEPKQAEQAEPQGEQPKK